MLLLLAMPAFAGSDALVAQVLDEHPELSDGTLTDWETVQHLRSFAYTHTDTVVSVTSPLYTSVTGWDAATAYAWFDDDRGGVICGGTSEVLVELLQLWGYDAWYLGFGDLSAGGFTHVETLVRIEHEGASLVTAHDAQLDIAYTDLDGAPLDYLDLLARLAREEADTVALTGLGELGHADTLVHPDDFGSMSVEDMAAANWTTDPDDYTVEELSDGTWKYRSPRRISRLETVIGPWYEPFLVDQGLPAELPYLHLFPFTVFGSAGGDEILAAALATIRAERPTTIGFEASEGFVVGDAGGTINHRYDSAGYDVQTWYYGGTSIVAVSGGQALQATAVDGLGGDYEAMFQFQAGRYGAVSVQLDPVVAGADVRFAVFDADMTLLDEQVGPAGLYEAEDPAEGIAAVIVEASEGDLLVDDFGFGPYTEPDGGGDGGAGDGGADGGAGDGGAGDGGADGGAGDGGADGGAGDGGADGGAGDGGADGGADAGDGGADGGSSDGGGDEAAGCGCDGGAGLMSWAWLPLAALLRRRRARR